MPPDLPAALKRERLFSKFSANKKVRLFLIQAGAGCGKTTLVSSYVQESAFSYCWYQLEDDDADPAVFMTHFSARLKKFWDQLLRQSTGPELSFNTFENSSLQNFLPAIVENLRHFPPLFIVLDDYHKVRGCQPLNTFVQSLVYSLPVHVRLIIISRSRIPLSVARFRVLGWMEEIFAEDLFFTLEETAQLLADLPLSEEELKIIWEKTEGWAAALSIIRYAFLNRDKEEIKNLRDLIRGHIEEFIKDEILSGLHTEWLHFWEKTSILDYPDTDLCTLLTGRQDAGLLLDNLAASTSFVFTRDNGVSYCYHQILRDYFLRRAASHLGSKLLQDLHAKAARAYLQRGEKTAALKHLFASGDLLLAKSLLKELVPDLLSGNNLPVLLSYLERIPDQEIGASADLLYCRSRVNAVRGRRMAAVKDLEKAEILFMEQNNLIGAARCALDLSAMSNEMGRIKQVDMHARRALSHLESTDNIKEKHLMLSEAFSLLSIASFLQEDWDESALWTKNSLAIFQENGSFAGQTYIWPHEYQLFICHPYRQDLPQKLRTFQEEARQIWSRSGNIHRAMMATICLAAIYRITEKYEEAYHTVKAALQQAKSLCSSNGKAFALFILGKIQQDKGDNESALETFQDVLFLTGEFDLPQLRICVCRCLSTLYRDLENFEAALKYAQKSLQLAEKIQINFFTAQAQVAVGIVRWLRGEFDEAIILFEASRKIFIRWQAEYDLSRVNFYLAGVKLQLQESAGNKKNKLGRLNWEEKKEIKEFVTEGLRLVRKNDYHFFFQQEKELILPVLRWAYNCGLEYRFLAAVFKELGEKRLPAYFKIFALGPLQIYYKGTIIAEKEWKNNKVMALFRFLLARKGQKIGRDILLETFWPEMEQGAAAHNLSSCLHALRRVLKTGTGKGSFQPVHFEKGFCWLESGEGMIIDVDLFLKNVELARRECAANNRQKAIAAYREALML